MAVARRALIILRNLKDNVILSHRAFDFYPDRLTRFGCVYRVVLDLHGLYLLVEIRCVSFDVDGVIDMKFSCGQFQNTDIYLGKVVSDSPNLFLHQGLLLMA